MGVASIGLILLGLYTLAREAFFLYTTQRLINKLMSRNYHEFQTAEKVAKMGLKPEPSIAQFEEFSVPEDLAHIGGF